MWYTANLTAPALHLPPPLPQVEASGTDVNVISWNGLVAHMLASGDDAGALRVWDLRAFKADGHVSQFNTHRCAAAAAATQWCVDG